MALLCKVCDSEILENESEHNNYLSILRKKNDKSLKTKYTIKIAKLDEFDKILNDCIKTRNKKLDFYFINCEFEIEFDKKIQSKYSN